MRDHPKTADAHSRQLLLAYCLVDDGQRADFTTGLPGGNPTQHIGTLHTDIVDAHLDRDPRTCCVYVTRAFSKPICECQCDLPNSEPTDETRQQGDLGGLPFVGAMHTQLTGHREVIVGRWPTMPQCKKLDEVFLRVTHGCPGKAHALNFLDRLPCDGCQVVGESPIAMFKDKLFPVA